ncbi:MAG: hypothetical protein KTR15_10560, partial [Phycisphaeraceae bacterium]|nr:hypothetical protein [Phycisphaeraceae bacterium]
MTRFFTTASLIAVSFAAAQAPADLVNHWTFDSADRSGNTAFDTAGAEANNAVSGAAVYAAGVLGDGAASFNTTGNTIFDIAGPMELTNAT